MSSNPMNVRSKWFPKFKKGLDKVTGKTYVITGTTSGTGYIAARTVGELGAEKIIVLNRPSERSANALEKLKKEVPGINIHQVDCDLLDLNSVRQGAEKVKELTTEIDCLALNAGIMATADEATPQGYDKQMQCNHLSHFLLTSELYPLVEAASQKRGDARIVSHTSVARVGSPLNEKYLDKNGGNLGGYQGSFSGAEFERYHQSKLANILFSQAIGNKLEAKGSKVKAVAAHPGLSTTNLGDHLPVPPIFGKIFGWFAQSQEDGTMGLLTCMVKKDVKNKEFYGPKGWFTVSNWSGKPKLIKILKEESDKDQHDLLWRMSEKACEVKFDLTKDTATNVATDLNKN